MFYPPRLGLYGQFAPCPPSQTTWYDPAVLSRWGLSPPPPPQPLFWPVASYPPPMRLYQPPQVVAQPPPPKRARIVTRKEDDDEDDNDDDDNEALYRKVRRNRRPRSLGATAFKDVEPNGETRLDIRFTSFGVVPDKPEHWGRKGVIPDGLAGRFTFYGEDWAFWIKYRDLVVCSDGVEHRLVEFGIRHKHWEVSETETEKQCRDRHNKGYTICNHVFALALERRSIDYQELLQRELQKEHPNINQIQQCQTRVAKLVPKRVSEGPLLFGLRHKAVRDAFASL